jgi:pilus assembly protein CpaB
VKSKVALAVAIVLGFIAAVAGRYYLGQKAEQYTRTEQLVPVVYTQTSIRRGQKLDSDMVTVKKVPQISVQPSNVLPSELPRVLRKPVLKNIESDAPLLWGYFIEERGGVDPATGLEEGHRQITIPVDKVTGCAGRLLPGTVVDVLVTLRLRKNPNAPVEPVTQTVLAGMKVVATDLNVRQVYTFISAKQRRDFAAYSTVTLEATPREANILAFLAEQGKLHLVIRRPDDATVQDPTQLEKVSLENLDTLIKKVAEEKTK